MPKLRTAEEFSAAVTSDLTWRAREISDLRAAAKQVSPSLQISVLRAGVPIIYAHWEGHIGYVANSYLDYLALRKPLYSSLKPHFLLNEFKPILKKIYQTELPYEQQISFLIKVLTSGDSRFRKTNSEIVSCRSNLRSNVLKDICCAIGIDYKEFEGDASFIDRILADRRNSVAHGQFVFITYDDFFADSERTIGLMRKFNNLVDNDVILKRYAAEYSP